MAIRVNPKLIDELEYFGSEDVQNCYHCGNCSAVCPHADEMFVFPTQADALPANGAREETRKVS